MARSRKVDLDLKKALESGSNLSILKAHRAVVVDDLLKADEFSDRVKLSSSLTQINKEIIKLEGEYQVVNGVSEAISEFINFKEGLK